MTGLPLVKSGPPHPDLPYRYGCSCGAVWNSSRPLTPQALCGPFCKPHLTPLAESVASLTKHKNEEDA